MNEFLKNLQQFCSDVKTSDSVQAWNTYRKIEAPLGPHYRNMLLTAWTYYERGNKKFIDAVYNEILEKMENGEETF